MLDKLDVFENRVRERAFHLWQEAGCPEDTAEEFWYRARDTEMHEFNLSEGDLHRVAHEKSPASDAADFA